jgi:hypothetical protein
MLDRLEDGEVRAGLRAVDDDAGRLLATRPLRDSSTLTTIATVATTLVRIERVRGAVSTPLFICAWEICGSFNHRTQYSTL